MGWNSCYTTYESTVINVYDAGTLTAELLKSLMQPYVGSDMDHGGSMGLHSKDGLSADEIVCKIMEPERYAEIPAISDEMPPRVKLVDGKYVVDSLGDGYQYDSWQEALQDERNSAIYGLWKEIVTREWNLW